MAALALLWLFQLSFMLMHFSHRLLSTQYWAFIGDDQTISEEAISILFGGLDSLQRIIPIAAILLAVLDLLATYYVLRKYAWRETRLFFTILAISSVPMALYHSWPF